MQQRSKAILWFLTAAAAVFEGTWVLIGGTPPWWGTALAILMAASGPLLGKAWQAPKQN